jgi:hypothetical protein
MEGSQNTELRTSTIVKAPAPNFFQSDKSGKKTLGGSRCKVEHGARHGGSKPAL